MEPSAVMFAASAIARHFFDIPLKMRNFAITNNKHYEYTSI